MPDTKAKGHQPGSDPSEPGLEPGKASDRPRRGAAESQERDENPELYAEMQARGLRDPD